MLELIEYSAKNRDQKYIHLVLNHIELAILISIREIKDFVNIHRHGRLIHIGIILNTRRVHTQCVQGLGPAKARNQQATKNERDERESNSMKIFLSITGRVPDQDTKMGKELVSTVSD